MECVAVRDRLERLDLLLPLEPPRESLKGQGGFVRVGEL